MTLTPSNTIIIAGLSKPNFQEKSTELRNLLVQKEIPVVHWAPLKSFGRIIVVLQSAQDALNAKLVVNASHPVSHFKVFFTQHTPLSQFDSSSTTNQDSHLKLPDAGRLWLISPPPSPPAGWESREEDPPNDQQTFSADDLKTALQMMHPEQCQAQEQQQQQQSDVPKLTKRCTLHESPSPVPHSPSTPTIVLEWEDDEPEASEQEQLGVKFVRTEMPPVA